MIVGSRVFFLGEFTCFIIAIYVSVWSYFPYDSVVLEGFDGGYNVCDEEFVKVVVSRGGMFNVIEKEKYTIKAIYKYECVHIRSFSTIYC